jgi:hypothetical protein
MGLVGIMDGSDPKKTWKLGIFAEHFVENFVIPSSEIPLFSEPACSFLHHFLGSEFGDWYIRLFCLSASNQGSHDEAFFRVLYEAARMGASESTRIFNVLLEMFHIF